MNIKEIKVMEFIKNHKKEVVIAAAAGVIGWAVGHKPYVTIKKNYGDLIEVVSEFGEDANMKCPFSLSLTSFLDMATEGAYPAVPYGDMTIGEALGKDVIPYLTKYRLDPTDKISGILVGIKR